MAVESARAQGSGLLGVLRRFPVTSYFVIALALSWIVVIVWVVAELPTTAITIVLITLGPFIAAFLMQAALNGRSGVVHLLRRMVRANVSWIWYAVAIVGIPLVFVLGTIVLPGALASMDIAAPPWITYLWNFPLVLAIGGPLLEEPGWRGFALPRLQTRFGYWGPLVGTILLGILWAAWHFPQFMMPEWAAQNGGFSIPSVLIYTASVIPITVIFTWLYNVTRGSLLIVILAHASVNTFSIYIVPLFPSEAGSLVNSFVGFGAAALLIVLFTRGRLGFDRYLREVDASELALDGVTPETTPQTRG